MQIVSSLGEGTNVELWLPRAEGRSTERASLEPGGSVLGPSQARILVCDDDGDVRALVGRFLRDSGYTVWEANNSALALQILERERPIDLLLVDYAPHRPQRWQSGYVRSCSALLRLEDQSKAWERWFTLAGVAAPERLPGPVLNRASMLIDAAIDGQGIALARTTLAAWDLISGRIVRPFDLSWRPAGTYWIVCPKPAASIPKIAAFWQWLLAEAETDARRLAGATG